ncbi:ubiquitin-like protein [Coniophora puteana RWD-64-598 SS2]|uniref:Ubiquitin-like protein n=1 Tax=Coniophora puteana (strain RWD-64-598) TaxID=741705 RepID=R7SET5_CONPW|nr:ubiquitin-like protein [Coniophora puteana RWD-64-598 SS2]EIW74237.1 ubiquitin-like protein [Coniophora puteana RWD-64-598 SS2]
MSDEDVKPKIGVTVSCGQESVTIQMKANTPFKKVFEAAEKRFNKQPGTLRFIHDGNRLQPSDTPAGVGMEDEDVIEAHLEQLGGSAI